MAKFYVGDQRQPQGIVATRFPFNNMLLSNPGKERGVYHDTIICTSRRSW